MSTHTQLKQSLLLWYRANRRKLPWRESKDAYRIWISEVMLQQTTVAAVIPYYERFLKAFPQVKDLAEADEEKVLSLWSGLGYYSRARNLQKAAKEIIKLKAFPKTYLELLDLPGVGPYTAAAIASIAFDEEVACIDGNVMRVVSRLFDISDDIKSKKGMARIQEKSTELISGQPPSDHNQAMMELGATLCIPKNPLCLICPVSKNCLSFKNGTQAARPVKQKGRGQEPWLWEMLLIKNKGRVALVKNNNGTPWLNHLWILPGRAAPWKKTTPPESDFKHSITHHKIFVRLKKGSVKDLPKTEVKWIAPDDIQTLGVSSVIQKALKLALAQTLMLIMAVFISSCHSANKPTETVAIQSSTDSVKQLTNQGENQKPKFSADGQRIIFISSKRAAHDHGQVYVLNLTPNKERRITHNDGEDDSPTFDPSGKYIIYSSTTDEFKEHLDAITPVTLSPPPIISGGTPTPAPSPIGIPLPSLAASTFTDWHPKNYEIYGSEADGSHIVRLTHSLGYDSEGSFSADGRKIIFTSLRTGDPELFVMDQRGEHQRQLTKSPGYDGEGSFSPDGKFILWRVNRENKSASQIFISESNGRREKTLTTKEALHWNPSWSGDSKNIIFASNRDDTAHFNLYMMQADGSCLKRLTRGPWNDLSPSFSPDKKKILFSSDRLGSPQIFLMDFIEPTDCRSDQP